MKLTGPEKNHFELEPAELARYVPASMLASTTTWHNPLQHPQTVRIDLGPTVEKTIIAFDDNTESMKRRTGKFTASITYVVEAGAKVDIPSAWDHAIQRVLNGVVVGGLAPQLRREGQTARLDPALGGTPVITQTARARRIED